MKRNSTDQLNQLPSETNQLPSLRIVYKNPEVTDSKPDNPARKARITTAVPKPVTKKPVAKEPLPQFNDYKFKARDYDPL